MKVYVVLGCIKYEGSDVIGVFSTPEMASDFYTICEDYEKTRYSGKSISLWIDDHPAGRSFDHYEVEEFELDGLSDIINN